jgi:hypothetical protein
MDRRLAETNVNVKVPMPPNRSRSDLPRCAHCGEVIGAYERFVEMIGGTLARETSRAAEPDVVRAPGATGCHMACYKARENSVREAP